MQELAGVSIRETPVIGDLRLLVSATRECFVSDGGPFSAVNDKPGRRMLAESRVSPSCVMQLEYTFPSLLPSPTRTISPPWPRLTRGSANGQKTSIFLSNPSKYQARDVLDRRVRVWRLAHPPSEYLTPYSSLKVPTEAVRQHLSLPARKPNKVHSSVSLRHLERH